MPRTGKRTKIVAAVALTSISLLSGCGLPGSGDTASSDQTSGVTINVVLAAEPPPQVLLDEFTEQTGISVNWTNLDWDSLQTKISASAAADTYFADVTDVDWSRVGQLGKLGWFIPMETLTDTDALADDMPQLASFTSDGHVVGIPYDASFMVTTVNRSMYSGYAMPSRLSAVTALSDSGELAGGEELVSMLDTSQPVFEGGAPIWYPEFSNAVYTALHAAATGSSTVQEAIAAMTTAAQDLAGDA